MATCTNCNYDQLAENARFCSNCGAPVKATPPQAPPEPENPQTMVNVDLQVEKIATGGRAVGTEVERVEGSVTVVHGNLIQIHDPSPELLASMQAMQAVPTQMQPKPESAEPADRQRLEAMEASVEKLLKQMDQAEKEGRPVDQVQAGQVQFSRVDLLIKQGVLLRSKVEMDLIEHVGNQFKAGGGFQGAQQANIDMEELAKGFDKQAGEQQLQQAYDYFAEAARLDPGNIEALLHQAHTASELDHADEASRLLYQVVNLIGHPSDDRQRFWMAQAKYLLAISSETPHIGMIQEARQIFAALGETSWIQQCDLILNSQVPTAPGMGTGTGFSPVGQWQVQVSSGLQMQMRYDSQGSCEGSFSPGYASPTSFYTGQWGYDPVNMILQQQGLVDGWSPVNSWVRIVQFNPGAFMAVDAVGLTYMFQRIG